MARQRVDLKKDVFSKAQYVKTIDTSFNELGVKSVSQQIQEETSVEEFFDLYSQLFYEIPAEGETNSHRYLVIQSGEYINFDENLEEIEALRQEIARLRTDILDLQIKNIELETGQKLNVNTDALKDQINTIGADIEANQASLAAAQEAAATANAQPDAVDITSAEGYFEERNPVPRSNTSTGGSTSGGSTSGGSTSRGSSTISRGGGGGGY